MPRQGYFIKKKIATTHCLDFTRFLASRKTSHILRQTSSHAFPSRSLFPGSYANLTLAQERTRLTPEQTNEVVHSFYLIQDDFRGHILRGSTECPRFPSESYSLRKTKVNLNTEAQNNSPLLLTNVLQSRICKVVLSPPSPRVKPRSHTMWFQFWGIPFGFSQGTHYKPCKLKRDLAWVSRTRSWLLIDTEHELF